MAWQKFVHKTGADDREKSHDALRSQTVEKAGDADIQGLDRP